MVFYDLWLVALDSIEMAWVMSNWVISIGQWSHETGFQKSESLSRIIQDLRIIQESFKSCVKFYYLFGVVSDICLNTVWCTDWLGRLHKMMGRNHRWCCCILVNTHSGPAAVLHSRPAACCVINHLSAAVTWSNPAHMQCLPPHHSQYKCVFYRRCPDITSF